MLSTDWLLLMLRAGGGGRGRGGFGSPGALRAPLGGWVKAVLPLDSPFLWLLDQQEEARISSTRTEQGWARLGRAGRTRLGIEF